MVASACARMMPGLASKPPQLPEWWPPSRTVSFRLKLSVPGVRVAGGAGAGGGRGGALALGGGGGGDIWGGGWGGRGDAVRVFCERSGHLARDVWRRGGNGPPPRGGGGSPPPPLQLRQEA